MMGDNNRPKRICILERWIISVSLENYDIKKLFGPRMTNYSQGPRQLSHKVPERAAASVHHSVLNHFHDFTACLDDFG